MIPDIHGEHFRMTDTCQELSSDKFKVGRYTKHLIIDRRKEMWNTRKQDSREPSKWKEELSESIYDDNNR